MVEFLQIAEYLSISVSVLFFALGSWLDLKTREVSDKAWLVYGPLGLAFSVYRLTVNGSLLSLALASMALTILVSFGLFYFGLFGGADAKAIICLGLTLPLAPSGFQSITGYVHPFFPIVVLIVGYLCSASVAVWLGLRNSLNYLTGHRMFEGLEHESVWKKILASITGYPTEISRLHETFYLYPMEKMVEDSNGKRRTFHLFVSAEVDRDKLLAELDEWLPKVGSPSRIWVTPGLPMLLFIFVGLIITLILGDPIFTTVFMLARR
jgi:preflagellin peptidase FlaK